MENFLINIQKYRPREDNNPQENFFTEIFSFILSKDKELVSQLLKLIGLSDEINTYKVKTQIVYSYGIIDIELIINNSISIFIENKLGSSVNKFKEKVNGENIVNNQLERYLKIQRENKKNEGYVVLLAQYYEAINEKISKQLKAHIFWKDIYLLFKNHKSDDQVIKFLIDQFIGLMEEENMDPYNKITKEMIEGYNDFLDNIYKLFDEVINEIGKTNQIKRKQSIVSRNYIDCYFLFKDITFSIDFNRGDFKLYVERKKLTSEQEDILEKQGFELNKSYFWKKFEIKQDFFDCSSEEQLKRLNQFYQDNFNLIKGII